jgi:hypothetical protein
MGKLRIKDRYTFESPDITYVKFRIDKGPEENRKRVLNIIDSSKSGFALLITEKDSDLLEILKEGDRLLDMSFFGIKAKIKENGTVKHMTKIKEGTFKGAYLLGVEAADI